ncbi:L,D-transpeptidase [Taibaiella koreensis]|uniref:L,D-transpeptidase n=1 Tax=Taibaiella koreensis TaxID=1268548 RepID=UPI000E59D1ED|nr:L,D-transpeptidase [Taibaiella koreensis]
MTTLRCLLLAGGCSLLLNTGCGSNEPNKEEAKTIAADSVKQKEPGHKEEAPVPAALTIRYHAYPVKGVDTAVKTFRKTYSAEQRWLILALNRLDNGSIGRADTLIVPDTLLPDMGAYSPFPAEVPMLKDVNKFVIFSYPIQAFAAYEKGKRVYWGPTSMGSKIHPTPTGLHFANWKAKETISTVNDEWKLKWNFNIANKEGVGWHQYSMPGYPASHSCLRMLAEQAQWMYSWAEQWIVQGTSTVLAQGTPVIVYGAYPFGSRRPWRNMLENAKANEISIADIEKEIEPYLQRILEQQQRREGIISQRQQPDTAAKPAS